MLASLLTELQLIDLTFSLVQQPALLDALLCKRSGTAAISAPRM